MFILNGKMYAMYKLDITLVITMTNPPCTMIALEGLGDVSQITINHNAFTKAENM